ncbi:hypothetical protein WJX74_005740 [Apatococcus lobatus]|uniref:Plastid lipid-associated protein/fibrillin conserved domain-containing protein n=2 Tax=Apatococcus TaxID=904362 RepID=A0AAW1SPN3_9CHLO
MECCRLKGLQPITASLAPLALQRLPVRSGRSPLRLRQNPRLDLTSRHQVVVRAGLLDFLPSSQPKSTPQSTELVNRLIELSEPTNSGLKASKTSREEIASLAEQLKPFRIRNPTKSPLFWGQFELLYCSLAIATGGPFIRGPAGQALLWGQQLRQVLTRPSTYLNRIEFRGLGLIPGEAKQLGLINAAAGNNFKVTLEAPTIKFGNGADKVQGAKSYPTQRSFEVLYLDEQLKIIKYLPQDVEIDPVLFVQRRVPVEALAATPEAIQQEEAAPSADQQEEEEQEAEPVLA